MATEQNRHVCVWSEQHGRTIIEKNGVMDALESLLLYVEAVIVVDSSGGEEGDGETFEELADAISQMESALTTFRDENNILYLRLLPF